jgi:hypothetical protein
MSTDHPRWVVVDDTDSNIQYSGPWFSDSSGSQDNVGNFGPAYKSTLHGTKANASFSYAFSGSEVTIFGSNNLLNDSGVLDPTWECFIDKISIPSTSPFQFPENNWAFCAQDQLVDGPHVITVNATVLKAQTFWFDSLQYVPSASVNLDQAAILVDNLDPQLQYGTGWGALGGTANDTGTTNSIFTFDFTGVSLSWYGFIPNEFPLTATTGSYSTDGQSPVNFLLKGLPPNTATTYNQKFFETATLPAGHHQIVVSYQGNSQTTPLTLDYLIVQNGTISSNSSSTASGTSPTSGAANASGTTHKSNNTGAIAGGVVGGLVLIVIAALAYIYFQRREKTLNEKVEYGESSPPLVEPFHYAPVKTSPPSSTIPGPGITAYPRHIPQLSTSIFPTTTHHGSMPSFTTTELQSAIAPSLSSGTSYPSNVNAVVHQSDLRQPNPGYLRTINDYQQPLTEKERREAEATATALRSQRSPQQPISPPFSDDSGSSRVVMHEDSGIRLPRAGEELDVVEVPPLYTVG